MWGVEGLLNAGGMRFTRLQAGLEPVWQPDPVPGRCRFEETSWLLRDACHADSRNGCNRAHRFTSHDAGRRVVSRTYGAGAGHRRRSLSVW